jgi:L-ascorbate metabolism protein UlaG (beta-lactamase superfamily)
LPPIDVVLLTHNHLDMATMQTLWARDRPRIVAPRGNDAVIARSRPEIVVEARDWREEVELGEGATVWLHPAYHWSARGIADRRMALSCGYVIATPVAAVYVADDTCYGDRQIFLEVADRKVAGDDAEGPGHDPRAKAGPNAANRVGLLRPASSASRRAAASLFGPKQGIRTKVALDYTAAFLETSLKRGSTNLRRKNSVASTAGTGAP